MLLEEARWLAEQLAKQDESAISPLLNVGSSTLAFRQRQQPFIEELLFGPLSKRGVEVVHVDIKAEEGVDVVADFEDEADLGRLLALEPRALLCSNLLEHVVDRRAAARSIAKLVPPSGLLILTVPYSYPYHADPLDTLYRPTPAQLAELFPEFEVVAERIIDCQSFGDELRGSPRDIFEMIARCFLPFGKLRRWLSTLHRWTWLFRRYRVTGLVLRRRDLAA